MFCSVQLLKRNSTLEQVYTVPVYKYENLDFFHFRFKTFIHTIIQFFLKKQKEKNKNIHLGSKLVNYYY